MDRHEWESEWQALEEQPRRFACRHAAELDELVGRILEARGFRFDDPAAAEGEKRELVDEFLAAHETPARVETGADDVSPGDVAAAVDGYRSASPAEAEPVEARCRRSRP